MRTWLFVLLFITMEGLLLGLGVWQLRRLTWKEGLMAAQTKALKESPWILPDALDRLDEDTWQFMPVWFDGVPAWDKALWFGPRQRFDSTGYDLILPLRIIAAGTAYDGRYVLVSSGFAPGMVPPAFPKNLPTLLRIQGILRLSEQPSWRMAHNDPAKNFWQLLYVPQIASAQGLKPFLPLWVQSMENSPALPWLKPLPRTLTLRNNHAQYAATWFTLAGLVALLAATRWRQGRKA